MGHHAAVWDHRAAIEIAKDWNGIDQITLRNPQGASARVSLHGGQVSSWWNDRGEELLFTSSKFGNCGSLEQHGFARNKIWSIEDYSPTSHPNDSHGKSLIDLLLKPSEEDLKCWPHSVESCLRISLASDGNSSLISRIRNINGKPFCFSFAYHTYFSLSDISKVRIEGLETQDHLHNLCQMQKLSNQR